MHQLKRSILGGFLVLSISLTSLVLPAMAAEIKEEEIPLGESAIAAAFSALTEDDGALNPNKAPMQVNAHMGDDPSSQINFTYATVEDAKTQVVFNQAGSTETTVATGESSQITNLNSGKYIHKIAVSGLAANTEYDYTVGFGENTYSGTFKTALPSGSKDSFTFAYLADTQVSNANNAKALGATLNRVNEMNPDFVYIAGDVTDTAANETQWEQLFYNDGAFPNGGQDMFGNSTLAVTQGNHDNNTMNRHINAPAAIGNIIYSFDYGPATFIILNLESARSDANARAQQKEYLTAVVEDAAARGQWTFVGFHKSLYTGASHVVDSDVIDARKFWCPIFAELDVDFVLQGHDHVYSRGFVEVDGAKADVAMDGDMTYLDPAYAPLYMIGGHAGGLKWYERINYNVTPGDPLLPGYTYLDVDSAGIQADGSLGSEVKQEQVIVSLAVSNDEVSVITTMFKYNTDSDTITTQEYVYDSFTVKRDTSEEAETNKLVVTTDANLVKQGDYFRVNTSLESTVASNAAAIEFSYDTDSFDYRGFTPAHGVAVLDNTATANGRRLTLMIGDYNAEYFGQVLFSAKENADLQTDMNTINVKAEYVLKAEDGTKSVANATGNVSFTTVGGSGIPGDFDGNGLISLIELSNVIDMFGKNIDSADWNVCKFCDVNNNGEIDILDISSIAKNLA